MGSATPTTVQSARLCALVTPRGPHGEASQEVRRFLGIGLRTGRSETAKDEWLDVSEAVSSKTGRLEGCHAKPLLEYLQG